VCVLVYARTYAQTTSVLDVSPGVGRTPGEPEESRSTKALSRNNHLLSFLPVFLCLFFSRTCRCSNVVVVIVRANPADSCQR